MTTSKPAPMMMRYGGDCFDRTWPVDPLRRSSSIGAGGGCWLCIKEGRSLPSDFGGIPMTHTRSFINWLYPYGRGSVASPSNKRAGYRCSNSKC